MLRWAAFQDDCCFQVTEVLEISYDVPIDPDRFVFEAPNGDAGARQGSLVNAAPGLLGRAPENVRPNSHKTRRHTAATLWLTGLPGAGKTTLGRAVARQLGELDHPVCVLDGDQLRRGLSRDLGLSREDRSEQARRAAEMAALISEASITAVVGLVSPYTADRARARKIHERLGLRFVEVWVDTPLEVCERRDPQGLYSAARAGELLDLTGVDAPYEPPEHPELRVAGHDEEPEVIAGRIVEILRSPTFAATSV